MWAVVCSVLYSNTPNGPLARYVKLRVAHAPGMPGTFSPPPRVSDHDMHHGTCVTPLPWCMPGSLTSGFLWNRWRGKRSRHSRCMRNPQFYVYGKRPMEVLFIETGLFNVESLNGKHQKTVGKRVSKNGNTQPYQKQPYFDSMEKHLPKTIEKYKTIQEGLLTGARDPNGYKWKNAQSYKEKNRKRRRNKKGATSQKATQEQRAKNATCHNNINNALYLQTTEECYRLE